MSQIAQLRQQTAPRSMWLRSCEKRATERGLTLLNWFISQANARGFLGAFTRFENQPIDPLLSNSDIVVGLLADASEFDTRALTLVTRMCQSGQLNFQELLHRAKRERASNALFWLLQEIPAEELNEHLMQLKQALLQPRGYQPLEVDFDSSRLRKKRATKETGWRVKQ